ncbi:MAG: CPBP family intramembrane glutamic endopeptidase [Pseudomonadota bacterium]
MASPTDAPEPRDVITAARSAVSDNRQSAHLYAHFLRFIKRPRTREELVDDRPNSSAFTAIFKLYALQLPLMACAIVVISMIGNSLSSPKGITEFVAQSSALQLVLMAVIVAPIGEELVFRTPLIAARWVLAIWLLLVSAVMGVYADTLLGVGPSGAIALASAFAVAGFAALLMPRRWFQAIRDGHRRSFFVLFWVSVLAFGFLHLSNYSSEQKATVLAPLLVLPQLIAGVFLGYLRVVYGLTSAIALHMLNNSLAVVPVALLSTANINVAKLGSGLDTAAMSTAQQVAVFGASAYFLLIVGGGMVVLLAMLSALPG